MSQPQFENFTASSLYCEKCKASMPVRERLLLVLPGKEIFDYLCTGCASSVGQREVTERSEEHTSELQSRQYLVCRLLLEKKKKNPTKDYKDSYLRTHLAK